MSERFIGFVKVRGARYGGTVAEFNFSGRRMVLDVRNTLIRQHNLRRDGGSDAETDRAVDGFQSCLDAQHWFDAQRDFEAWLAQENAETP